MSGLSSLGISIINFLLGIFQFFGNLVKNGFNSVFGYAVSQINYVAWTEEQSLKGLGIWSLFVILAGFFMVVLVTIGVIKLLAMESEF